MLTAVMASPVMFSQGVAWYGSYGLAFVCFGWAVKVGFVRAWLASVGSAWQSGRGMVLFVRV